MLILVLLILLVLVLGPVAVLLGGGLAVGGFAYLIQDMLSNPIVLGVMAVMILMPILSLGWKFCCALAADDEIAAAARGEAARQAVAVAKAVALDRAIAEAIALDRAGR